MRKSILRKSIILLIFTFLGVINVQSQSKMCNDNVLLYLYKKKDVGMAHQTVHKQRKVGIT